VGLLAPIREHLTALMRPSVAGHRRASMLPGLVGGVVALAAVGAAFTLQGVPRAFDLALLGLLLGVALIGYFLVRARVDATEEDRYRVLARNMEDVITRHGHNGQVLFVSPAAEPVFGAKPPDLHGRGLFDRVHVADRPAYLTALGDAASLRAGRTVEIRIRRDQVKPDSAGAFVWIEMRCWPLAQAAPADADADCEVVAVMRDVTARKDEEHAIEDARAEAERANVAKSRFLATMSHELRTPLNAIIGFSEMLREEGALKIDAKQRHDYAHLINESGHHLLSVVNGILDMSKIESGNFEIMPEPVAVARVIAECCDLLALRAREAGVDVVVRLPDRLPAIVADKRALLQIMLNLLSNALKFTSRGGRVAITAAAGQEFAQESDQESAQESARESVHDSGREAGPEAHMVITVEDTGVGIGTDDLPRVGEPFFQARSSYDRRHDGTGLGVSIVKGLLALHGGLMEIESQVGEGTRVTIHLPLDCERARRRSAALPRIDDARPDIRADLRADLRLGLRSDTAVKKSA
jgi:two-component system, cell cycle sensor histidine kinase DivJ